MIQLSETLPQATATSSSPRNNIPLTVALSEHRTNVWIQNPLPTQTVVNAQRSRSATYKIMERKVRDANFVNMLLSFLYSVYTPYYLISSFVAIYGFIAIFTYDNYYLKIFLLISCIQCTTRFVAMTINLVFVFDPFFLSLSVIGILCDVIQIGYISIMIDPPENPNIRTLCGSGPPQNIAEVQEVTIIDPENSNVSETSDIPENNNETISIPSND